MDSWAALAADALWRNALAAVPLALLVAAVCRWVPCRPATRHVLWLGVLLWLIVPPVLPSPQLAGERLIRPPAAEAIVPASEPVEVASSEDAGLANARATAVLRRHEPRRLVSQLPNAYVRPRLKRESPEEVVTISPPTGSSGRRMRPSRADVGAATVAETDAAVSAVPIDVNARSVVAPAAPTTSGHAQAQGEAASGVRPGTRLAWGQRWLAGVMRARDAIGQLPPVPPLVWACGGGLIGLLAALRTGLFFRRVRSALPAPASVTNQVRAACREIGVRRVPDVFLLEQRVSPLIWRPLLAKQARLVLPTELWSQLDKTSRRAVLFHELAHLRRRDHWVRWAELIVAAVYWWHPVVWWVRNRLHEEAELCCDAWVTWLLPRGRRAYAEALLTTRQYTRRPGWAVPAVGIGITTGRAKRFARRLTMVMTESSAPRASASGLALMLALAVAGWVATPAQSCPPKKGCAKAPPCASKTAVVAEKEAQAASTFEEYLVKKEAETASEEPRLLFVSHGDDGFEERLERLEAQMEHLAQKMEQLADKMGAKRSDISRFLVAPPAPKMPKLPPITKMEKGLFEVGGPSKAPAPKPASRKYLLSGDRLKALTALMVRDDVPVLVRPLDDGIEVIGDCTVQAKFGAFVGLLDAAEEARVYRLPEGKLKALTELMILSDVPVKVRPGDDGLTVYGTGAVHAIFEQFVWMLEPGHKKIKKTADTGTRASQKTLEEYYRAAALGQAAQAKEYDTGSEAYRTALKQYQKQAQKQYQQQAQQKASTYKAQQKKKTKACDD